MRTDIDLKTSIFNEVSIFVEKMKKENIDLETVKLILEEVWRNGQFSE
ncbi:MAG TPA: hypothetical protein GXX68_06930 [Defluviitoga tunisiensis]|nr:hypothetical protein [Defluviitoga tunisiensis]